MFHRLSSKSIARCYTTFCLVFPYLLFSYLKFFYLIFSGLRDNVLRFIYAYGILALVSVVAVSYGMFYLYVTAQQICVVDTDSVATVCNYFWLMFNIEA